MNIVPSKSLLCYETQRVWRKRETYASVRFYLECFHISSSVRVINKLLSFISENLILTSKDHIARDVALDFHSKAKEMTSFFARMIILKRSPLLPSKKSTTSHRTTPYYQSTETNLITECLLPLLITH